MHKLKYKHDDMPAETSAKKTPNPVDVHVGRKLRLLRTFANLSQTELGQKVGVSFQQIQKYEKGSNRVSASMLVQFAKILHVRVSDFFETPPLNDEDEAAEETLHHLLCNEGQDSDVFNLLKTYCRLSVRDRYLLMTMGQTLANTPGE